MPVGSTPGRRGERGGKVQEARTRGTALARTDGKMAGDSPSQRLGTGKEAETGAEPHGFLFGFFFSACCQALLVPRARSQGAPRLEGETRFSLDTVVKGIAT